jgi:hypothetical protein
MGLVCICTKPQGQQSDFFIVHIQITPNLYNDQPQNDLKQFAGLLLKFVKVQKIQ